MSADLKLEGMEGLKAALAQLPKATSRNVQRRVLLRRAQPVVDTAKGLAPVLTGALRDSITATTRRPKGRKTAAARAFASTRGAGGSVGEARAASKEAGSEMVEVFVGPGRLAQATMQEFGTVHHAPHPYLRPAWDSQKAGILVGIGKDMGAEIEAAGKRLAKKAAKRGG